MIIKQDDSNQKKHAKSDCVGIMDGSVKNLEQLSLMIDALSLK
jgi:hypothetical protein